MGNVFSNTTTRAAVQAKAPTVDPLVLIEHEPLDFQVDEVPTVGGLSTTEAWEIALAWRDELRGCIRLERDSERCGFRMIDSFEWVTFVFDGSLEGGLKPVENVEDTAEAARAATIAWYALSCCAGFSGTENPRFWRRVFTELYYPEYPEKGIILLKARPDRPQHPITETTAFFPNKDKPFPRIRIVPTASQAESCFRVLMNPSTVEGSTTRRDSESQSHTAKLDHILARLKPFIRTSIWCHRSIPVAVDGVSPRPLFEALVNAFVSEYVSPQPTTRSLPKLELTSIFLSPNDLNARAPIQAILHNCNAQIVVAECHTPYLARDSESRVSWTLADADSVEHNRILLSTVDFTRTFAGAANPYPPVFSALPHGQSITTIKNWRYSRSAGEQELHKWLWLGYAAFHPDAPRLSSFTDLEIDLSKIPTEGIQLFATMMRGNNLLINSGVGAASLQTTYDVATVRARAMALSEPRDGAEVLKVFSAATNITLCGSHTAAGRLALGDWVSAVIAGVGLGWIRGHDIIDVTSRTPNGSCLKRLRMAVQCSSEGYQSMEQMLALVGQGLVYLEILNSEPMDTKRVQAVLNFCPLLQELRIGHDGSCWADRKISRAMPTLPRLQYLELAVGGNNIRVTLKALKSPALDNLIAFRVATQIDELFSTNKKAFLSTLKRYPQLRYAHHTNGKEHESSWSFKSYEDRRREMLSILGKIHRGIHDVSQGPMNFRCSLAFLSVIHHHSNKSTSNKWTSPTASALSHFDPDVVRNILTFSTSPVARELFIDQVVGFRY